MSCHCSAAMFIKIVFISEQTAVNIVLLVTSMMRYMHVSSYSHVNCKKLLMCAF